MINFHLLVSIFCEFVLNDVAIQLLLSPKVTEALFTQTRVKKVSKLDCLTASLNFDLAIFEELIQMIDVLYQSKERQQEEKGEVFFKDLSLLWEITDFPEKKRAFIGLELAQTNRLSQLVH